MNFTELQIVSYLNDEVAQLAREAQKRIDEGLTENLTHALGDAAGYTLILTAEQWEIRSSLLMMLVEKPEDFFQRLETSPTYTTLAEDMRKSLREYYQNTLNQCLGHY